MVKRKKEVLHLQGSIMYQYTTEQILILRILVFQRGYISVLVTGESNASRKFEK